jgi:hypothetical protein
MGLRVSCFARAVVKSDEGDERERGERDDAESGHESKGMNLAILLPIEFLGCEGIYFSRCGVDDSDEREHFWNSGYLA